MSTEKKTPVTIETTVNAPIKKVWEYWTKPEHIKQWNNASEDWHTPRVENDLRPGGSFTARMEARDGSMGFDFGGVYDTVTPQEYIAYTLGDGRKVAIQFTARDQSTDLKENFDPEDSNPVDMQKTGWQAILDNFKKYTENN